MHIHRGLILMFVQQINLATLCHGFTHLGCLKVPVIVWELCQQVFHIELEAGAVSIMAVVAVHGCTL